MTDADIAVILRRLDEQDKSLERIERKVDKTNGRVTTLETKQEVDEALARNHAKGRSVRNVWLVALISGVVTGGVGSVVLVLAGGHP